MGPLEILITLVLLAVLLAVIAYAIRVVRCVVSTSHEHQVK
jgi:Tfp pilus assembly protein PilV